MYQKVKVRKYQDLIVWKKSIDLSLDVYSITKDFPKEEVFGLVQQLRRCAVSIPSNIAEGNGRNKNGREYKQFLCIARGSLQELETQLLIAHKLEYIRNTKLLDKISEEIKEIEKMLNAIISRL